MMCIGISHIPKADEDTPDDKGGIGKAPVGEVGVEVTGNVVEGTGVGLAVLAMDGAGDAGGVYGRHSLYEGSVNIQKIGCPSPHSKRTVSLLIGSRFEQSNFKLVLESGHIVSPQLVQASPLMEMIHVSLTPYRVSIVTIASNPLMN
jgi:hypothetical protein